MSAAELVGILEFLRAAERRDLETLVAPLPAARREEILALWGEDEAAASPEAWLAKALDPPDVDYRFNLEYGRRFTADHPAISTLRAMPDSETERRAVDGGRVRRT